jgi:hypothetical protein
MREDSRTTLELLRLELEFLDSGGYKRNAQSPWRPPYIFEESPSCPNFSDGSRPHACADCWLVQFVSPELRDEQVPCRFVQLMSDGVTTVDSLYRHGAPAETEQALRHWLRQKIHELENELSDIRVFKADWIPVQNRRLA